MINPKPFSFLAFAFILFTPSIISAQTPNVRSLANFVMFTTTGNLNNVQTSNITGDYGTGSGAINNFVAPSTFSGTPHIADATTTQATTDLNLLYNEVNAAVPTIAHAAAFGASGVGETIVAGVYYIAGAGSFGSVLNLDASNNSNAVFIFQFDGAFTTGAGATVNLINGAQACNVFFRVNGAIAMAAGTNMKGTLIANPGAVSIAPGGTLEGRMLSTAGALSISSSNITATPNCAVCITPAGSSTWLGVNNNWQNASNWCGGVPVAATSVIIPSSLSNYPIISSTTANCNNITIASGASIIVSGTGVMSYSGSITNAGVFDITDGTLNLAATNQIIAGSTILNGTVKNLTISSGASTSIKSGGSNMLSVKNNLSFLTSNNTFTTNDNLSLLSTAATTASVTDMTSNNTISGNSIVGNANVERFIPSLKRWRFLAINTEVGTGSKNTVQENWMEGQAPGANAGGAGKGLWITDVSYTSAPVNYDATSFTPSIKWFNGTAYVGIGNPLTFDIRTYPAYFTYIRGDRGCTASNGILSTTVLRTFGNLAQGNRVVNIPSGGTNNTSTGNPYASAIDLRNVVFSNTDVINVYVWDPKKNGFYGQGAFQLLTRDPNTDPNFTIIPGGGSYGTSTMNTIESGLGFFVQGSATARTLTYKETSKTSSQNNAFRTTVVLQKLHATLSVVESLDSLTLVDAFQVRMANNYSTALDANDARKRSSSGENVASSREGTLLTMEYRNNAMSPNDTLLINCTNLLPKNYRWIFTITALNEPGRVGVLVDQYLGTETVLNLDSINNYNFAVTSTAGSFNANRFLIIFRQMTVLPIKHINLTGKKNPNGTIGLSWKVENETTINHYETEKSNSGALFVPFGINTVATDNNGGNPSYSKLDETPYKGENYYRIKSVDNDMHFTYSQILKIKSAEEEEEAISVYPNPVANKTIELYLKAVKTGIYHLRLSETSGQTIYNGNVIVDGTVVKKEILIKSSTAFGNYELEITNDTGFKKIIAVTVLN